MVQQPDLCLSRTNTGEGVGAPSPTHTHTHLCWASHKQTYLHSIVSVLQNDLGLESGGQSAHHLPSRKQQRAKVNCQKWRTSSMQQAEGRGFFPQKSSETKKAGDWIALTLVRLAEMRFQCNAQITVHHMYILIICIYRKQTFTRLSAKYVCASYECVQIDIDCRKMCFLQRLLNVHVIQYGWSHHRLVFPQ